MASYHDAAYTFPRKSTLSASKDMTFADNDSLLAILEDICKYTNNDKAPPSNSISYQPPREEARSTRMSPDLTRYRSSSLIPVPTTVHKDDFDFGIPGAPRLGLSQRSISMSAIHLDGGPLPPLNPADSVKSEPYAASLGIHGYDTHSSNFDSLSLGRSTNTFPHQTPYPVSRPSSRARSHSDALSNRSALGIAKTQSLSDLSKRTLTPTPYRSALSSLSEAGLDGNSPDLYLPPNSFTSASEFASNVPSYHLHRNYSTSYTDLSSMGYELELNDATNLQERIPYKPTLTSSDYASQIQSDSAHYAYNNGPLKDTKLEAKQTQQFPQSSKLAPRLSLDSIPAPNQYGPPQNKVKIARIQNPATQRQKNKARRASVRRQSAGLNRAYQCPVDNCTRRYEAWRSLQYHLKMNHQVATRLIQGQILATRKDSLTERDITRDITSNLITNENNKKEPRTNT